MLVSLRMPTYQLHTRKGSNSDLLGAWALETGGLESQSAIYMLSFPFCRMHMT